MISKQEREEIQKEYENLQSAWSDIDFPIRLGIFADNVPRLLDALDEMETQLEQEKFVREKYISQIESARVKVNNEVQKLIKEWNELEARAEKAEAERYALVRAIKQNDITLCDLCVYRATDEKEADDLCFNCRFYSRWVYDYDRFAKGGAVE